MQMFSASGQERATTKKLPPLNVMMQQLEKQTQKKEVEVNKPQLQPQQGIVPVGKKRYSNYVELVKNVSDAVVTVLCFTEKDRYSLGHGSGFFISPNRIITNYHVIETNRGTNYEPLTASIQKKNGKEFTVKGIVAYDKINDVAMLEVEEKGANNVYLPLADKDPEVGEEVVVIGTPTDLSLSQTVTTGIVSAKRGEIRISNQISNSKIRSILQNRLQISAPVTHGSSGSPVFNMNGEVVGIVVSGLAGSVDEINLQNYNVAVPTVYARDLKPMAIQTIGEVNRKESGLLRQENDKLTNEVIKIFLEKIEQFNQYFQQGKCDKAFSTIVELKKIVTKEKQSDLYYQLAHCYYDKQEFDFAIKALELSINFSENPLNTYRLAFILYYQKQLADRAIELLEKSILLDRNFTEAITLFCQIHAERGTESKYCPEMQYAESSNHPTPARKGLSNSDEGEPEVQERQAQTPTSTSPSQKKQTQTPPQIVPQQQTQIPIRTISQQSLIVSREQKPMQQQPPTRQISETMSSPISGVQHGISGGKSLNDSIDPRSVEEIYRSAVRLKSMNHNTEAHREYLLLKAKDEYLACHLYFTVLYPKRTKEGKDFFPCEDPIALKTYFRDEGDRLPSGLYSK
jgi:S1-C subfamily serine protease